MTIGTHGSVVVAPEQQTEAERPTSPDIIVGAYLVSHLGNSFCESCGTTQTPQWRKGWYSELLHRSVNLCNACGLKFHKRQFCYYCKYVYGKEEDKMNSEWITCFKCRRLVHAECEVSYGQQNGFKTGSYLCPDCRRSRMIAAPPIAVPVMIPQLPPPNILESAPIIPMEYHSFQPMDTMKLF